MKSFKRFITEQKPGEPPTPYSLYQDSEPLDKSLEPYDMEVINAFFRGEPDVVGINIVTKQNDDRDYNTNELRIDLLDGRGTKGLVLMSNDIISLATLGQMVDESPLSRQVQSIVRNMARDKDIRVM